MVATDMVTESANSQTMVPEDLELFLRNLEPSYNFQVDQSIRLFFNKTIFTGSGDIILSNGSDRRVIAINDADQVAFEGDTVIINPATDLVENTAYTLQIASGVIVDAGGSAFEGINNLNFPTTIAASNPQMTDGGINGQTEFQVDQNINLRFDETVVAGAGNIIISNGADIRTIAIDDTSQVTFNGSKVSIDPTEDLLGDTTYSIQIADGVINDREGNAYAGSNDTMFATISTDPELLFSNLPGISNLINDSTLKSDANIELVFNRTVTTGLGDIILSNGVDTRTIPIDDASQVIFDSNKVTINPADDLNIGETYTIQIAKGVITDTVGHDYAGFSDATVTIVEPNPQLVYSSPFNSSTLVVDGHIELYFDEPVTAGSGEIIFTSGTDIRTISIDDINQVMFNSHVVTINLTEDLLTDVTYTVQMAQGAITDTAGHEYAGFTDGEVTTISSDPFIVSSNINTISALKNDDNIQLYFNESIELGSGNIVISDGVDTHTIAIDDASQVSLDTFTESSLGLVHLADSIGFVEHSVLTINPAADLVANSTYTVQIDEGIVTDTAGHEFAGFSSATFPTRTSEPLLLAGQPQDGETLKVDDNIRLYFDEAVQAGNGNIVITNGTDTRTVAIDDTSQITFSPDDLFSAVFTSVDEGTHSGMISDSTTTMTINLNEDLVPNSAYSIRIDSGVIVDTAGNAYAGLNNTAFSTIVSEPLLVPNNFFSEESTIKTDDVIRLRFDEAVVAGSGDIILSNGSDTRTIAINDVSQVSIFNGGKTVTIDPTEDLIADTTYSVQIAQGVITDETGNSYVGSSNTMVTTSNPLLTFSNPVDGSLIKTDGNIILQFDEPIVAGSGNIILSNGSDTRTIAINDASQVTINTSFNSTSKVAIIDPTEDLIGDTSYSVQIDSGAITDEAGNPYAGLNDATITATDAPLLAFSPDGHVISTRDNITLYFDEAVFAGEGDILISNGTDMRTIAVDDTSQVSFAGDFGDMNVVTINPSEDLEADTTYQIQIASGVIIDTDGNAYGGISEADMFDFSVEDFGFGMDPFAPLL